jgi:hypothetical protein
MTTITVGSAIGFVCACVVTRETTMVHARDIELLLDAATPWRKPHRVCRQRSLRLRRDIEARGGVA